jgi:hypothetical protein
MFDSLDQVIKHDDAVENTRKQRILDGVAIALLSVVLFVGLYLAVHFLE